MGLDWYKTKLEVTASKRFCFSKKPFRRRIEEESSPTMLVTSVILLHLSRGHHGKMVEACGEKRAYGMSCPPVEKFDGHVLLTAPQ